MTVPAIIADRERAGTGAGPGLRRTTRAAGAHVLPATPPAGGFWLVAAVLALLFFVAAAPSPLYGVYQAQWRFSAITLTEVFAVYALFLLVTLLVFGSVSDYLGRRRVILAGLVMTAGACGLFLAAHGVGLLFAARALHGAAVGTSVSALGAALIDLQPEGSRLAAVVTSAASILGLAAGGLAASALVQYGPAPTHLVWWLLLGLSLVAAMAVVAMPETAPRRPGVLASLRPRVAVPGQARRTFAMALPCLTAVWMLSGFYLSLGPSLAAHVLRSSDLLWGGVVIFLVDGTGAAAAVVSRGVRGPAAMLAGSLALLAGAVVTLGCHRDDIGGRLPGRDRGGGRGLRDGHAGHLPDRERTGGSRPAGRPDCRVLHRVLRGVQCPGGGRRSGHHPLWPAPDCSGLRRGHRRSRRVGRGQPDACAGPPSALAPELAAVPSRATDPTQSHT